MISFINVISLLPPFNAEVASNDNETTSCFFEIDCIPVILLSSTLSQLSKNTEWSV